MVHVSSEHADNGLEIRIHGIGDHDQFSALDGPTYSHEDEKSQVWIEGPPDVPANALRMINWSRANRKLTRNILWYLAFPFTLLNVAGYMEPPRKQHAPFLRLSTFVVGLCMTLSLAVWASAVLETALRWLVHAPDSFWTRIALSASVPLALAYAVFHRLRHGKQTIDRGDTTFSIVTIAFLLLLAVVLFLKPAGLHYPHSERPVDVMALFVAVTSLVALVVALLLSGSACVTRYVHPKRVNWSSKDGASYAGAALLCLLAIALLHASGSVLRLVTSAGFDVFRDSNRQVPIAHMLVFQPVQEVPGAPVTWAAPLRIDLLPIFLAELIAVFLICLLVMFRISSKHAKSRQRLREERNKSDYAHKAADGTCRQPMARTHDLLSDIGTILPLSVLATSLLTFGLWTVTAGAYVAVWPDTVVDRSVDVLKFIGVIIVVFLIARRPEAAGEKLRKFFGSIGDIAGFWSPDVHPLAGRSYRKLVIDAIAETANKGDKLHEPVALVGHSQGSVVSAWFVASQGVGMETLSDRQLADYWQDHRSPQSNATTVDGVLAEGERPPPVSRQVGLITCGCPLDTLYATFFPRFFSEGFFRVTHEMSADHRWLNYWRQTDPIASPLPHARNHNVTEALGDPTLEHGKYFTNPEVRDGVDSILRPTLPGSSNSEARAESSAPTPSGT